MIRRWIEAFRGEPTNMIGYLVGDTTPRTTGVIDPVLETHDNADRRSAAPPFIKAQIGVWIRIAALAVEHSRP